jgi:hypothetical protein
MIRLPRISEIIKVEPFKVTCRWTTAEVLVVDFEELFQKWQLNGSDLEYSLTDFDTFKYVSVSEQRTLQWVNLQTENLFFDENGNKKTIKNPLSIDPDVLYKASVPIEYFRLVLA